MKRIIATAALVATTLVPLTASARKCSLRNDGAPAILPAIGAVLGNGGTSEVESRLGAGVQLGATFGWQLCHPGLFLGLGATYSAFAYDYSGGPTYSFGGRTGQPPTTTTPTLFDGFVTARVFIVGGLFADAFGGLTSSAIIRERPPTVPGAVAERSSYPLARDVASDGGAMFGMGVGYALQLPAGEIDLARPSLTVVFDPTVRVLSTGTQVSFPLVIGVTLPLD